MTVFKKIYKMGVLGMDSSDSVWGQVTGYRELDKEISESIKCTQLIAHCRAMDYLK
jgi:hypothetical protein